MQLCNPFQTKRIREKSDVSRGKWFFCSALYIGAVIAIETVGWVGKHMVATALIVGAAIGGYHLYNKDDAKQKRPPCRASLTGLKRAIGL